MKVGVLATITPEKNKTYIEAFNRLVSDKASYLSNSDLMEIYPQRPIIGQVLESCFECKKVLRLRRFENVDKSYESIGKTGPMRNIVWLVTSNISRTDSLSIGNNGLGIEIFQEACDEKERYFLENAWTKKRPDWLKPPIEFLQQTYRLLPIGSQQEFNLLRPNEKQ